MPEALKDTQYGQWFFDNLTGALQRRYPPFDKATFLARVFDEEWNRLELKGRMRHITEALHQSLPDDYPTALGLLRQAALTFTQASFANLVFADFVECYGLDDVEASIPALELFTQLGSAEFAVRPFIVRYPERMMAQMLVWSKHDNAHVRRFASEGCRPRLPWGMGLPALKADPSPILPILEQLKADESDSVRLSVANNLNDISKDNPQVVIDLLRRWQADNRPAMRALISRALRTLVKQGNADALALLGYAGDSLFIVKNLTVEPDRVPMGGNLTFSFTVESLGETPQSLMIDYIVHLQRANGQLTPKVFKLAKKVLAPGQSLTITRRHSFKPVTTRKYYPGDHAIEIQINGVLSERFAFVVTA